MEEIELQDKPGFFSRIASVFTRTDDDDFEVSEEEGKTQTYALRSSYRYHVTVRREILSFDDAYAAANGLKRGEQQILNLTLTEPSLRQKIVDFMSGVSFAQDANWEEIGEHIYLVCPGSAFVEVAAGMPKASVFRSN